MIPNRLWWLLWGRRRFLFSSPQSRAARTSLLTSDCMIGPRAVISRGAVLSHTTAGRHLYVAERAVLDHCRLGSFCSIAPEAHVGGLGRHPLGSLSTHGYFYQETGAWNDTPAMTELGNDVWIGFRAVVKDGVQIGTGAVVGACSLVTKDVPPYAIVAGVPARILRYRFDPPICARLLESRWWEAGDASFAEAKREFADAGPDGVAARRMLEAIPHTGRGSP